MLRDAHPPEAEELAGIDKVLRNPSWIWVFPKIGVPQNGSFIMENLIKMDDLGVPLFSETSISSIVLSWNPLKVQERRAELAAALAPCTVCSLIFDEASYS